MAFDTSDVIFGRKESRIAAASLDDLVEVVTAYGFGYPMQAEDSVATTRAKMFGLGICMALVALILAKFWIFHEQAVITAIQIAGRVAERNFTDQIASNRRDEPGRLMNSLAIMRNSLEARAKNAPMMVKRSPPGLWRIPSKSAAF